MALITCEKLELAYENRVVVSDLSFTVEKGDSICIVGENGAGKTTLMKALLGLLHPKSGRIIYGDGLQRRRIGYLPQITAIQRDFPASVYEIVLSGCLNQMGFRPFYTRRERRRADEVLEKLQIGQLKNKYYHALSGGQQQRVLLARALCAAGELLILDEPAAGLDPVVTTALYQLISDLNREGMTTVMVSHDIQSAVQYANKILHLQQRPLFFGTTSEYQKTKLGQSFLGGDNACGNC